MVVTVRCSFIDRFDLIKIVRIGSCAKQKKKEKKKKTILKYNKKLNKNVKWTSFPNVEALNNPRLIDMPLEWMNEWINQKMPYGI